MRKILAALFILLLTVIPLSVFAQTEQEINAEAYLPRHPINQCSTWALTGVMTFEYVSSTATAATIANATTAHTLTVTIGGTAATYDWNAAAYDTYAELAAALMASHTGLVVHLGDQVYGDETTSLADVVETNMLNTEVSADAVTHVELAARLYYSGKTPVVYRVIANTTYSSGNSILYVYQGSDDDTITGDTLIWKQVLSATTVDKDIDLSPYMISGTKSGYLKVVIKNSAALTAGNLTILGAYK